MTILHPTWGFDMFGPPSRSSLPGIEASGVAFVGGYLWDGSKGMTPDSAQMISGAGLRLLSYYEARGDQLSAFSAEQGKLDAGRAVALAQRLDQPKGTSIFFAVDLDEDEAAAEADVLPYFEALKRELDGEYSVEGYGSGLTLETLIGAGLIIYSVLGAIGWRDGHAFLPKATVVQKPPSDPYHFGFEVDPLFSQVPLITPFTWSTGGSAVVTQPPAGVVLQAAVTNLYTQDLQMGSQGDAVRVVQALLGVGVDGIWGDETEAAAAAYRSEHGLVPGAPLRLEAVLG